MKKCKKPARGQRFQEGEQVLSLRRQDGGRTGVVIAASRKRFGWSYTVMLDGLFRAVTRGEEELTEVEV